MTHDPYSTEVIAGDLTEWEATSLVDFLRERGIDAHPGGTHVAALCPPFRPGFAAHVFVKQTDAEQARKAVEEFRLGRLAH